MAEVAVPEIKKKMITFINGSGRNIGTFAFWFVYVGDELISWRSSHAVAKLDASYYMRQQSPYWPTTPL